MSHLTSSILPVRYFQPPCVYASTASACGARGLIRLDCTWNRRDDDVIHWTRGVNERTFELSRSGGHGSLDGTGTEGRERQALGRVARGRGRDARPRRV